MANHHAKQYVQGNNGKLLSVGSAYKVSGNPNRGLIGKTAQSAPKAPRQRASATVSPIPTESRFAPIPATPQNRARDQGFVKAKQVPASKREHASAIPQAADKAPHEHIKALQGTIGELLKDMSKQYAKGNLARVAVLAGHVITAETQLRAYVEKVAEFYAAEAEAAPRPNPLQKPHITIRVKPRLYRRWSDK